MFQQPIQKFSKKRDQHGALNSLFRNSVKNVTNTGPERPFRCLDLKVLEAQADLGLDVVTDGEMERGAYYMQVKIQDSKVYCRPNISNYMQVEYSTHYQIICSAGEIYH